MVGAWLVLTEPPYATNSGMPSYPLVRMAEHLLCFFKLRNTSYACASSSGHRPLFAKTAEIRMEH